MTKHDYIILAPQENVPYHQHKRRPGKQSNLTKPRDTTRALSKCKVTRADGSTYIMGETRKSQLTRGAVEHLDTPAGRAAEFMAAKAERLAAMHARIAGNYSSDHWSTRG